MEPMLDGHELIFSFLVARSKGAAVFGDSHIKETDGFCASLPLVVKFAGQPDMLDKVS
jgi:hypothetical protein